jgi:hypothetical protein
VNGGQGPNHGLRQPAPARRSEILQHGVESIEPAMLGIDRFAQLEPPPLESPAHRLVARGPLQDVADAGQRETQLPERENAIEALSLTRGVIPVARARIHEGRRQQTDSIVVPEGLDGHAGQP